MVLILWRTHAPRLRKPGHRRLELRIPPAGQIRRRGAHSLIRNQADAFDAPAIPELEADFAESQRATAGHPGVAEIAEQAAAGSVADDARPAQTLQGSGGEFAGTGTGRIHQDHQRLGKRH